MCIKKDFLEERFLKELNFFQRATLYPYKAPDFSFSFLDGAFVKGLHLPLKDRYPVLSIGSNRSPYQLMKKFTSNDRFCVTPAYLYEMDVVYSALISSYGSIPATLWPSAGTKVKLNIAWLNETQLNKMHLTEGIGIAYEFIEIKYNYIELKDCETPKKVFAYVSKNGAIMLDNLPLRLSAIVASNKKFYSKTELSMLRLIKELFVKNNHSLKDWIKKIIQNKNYRLDFINLLSAQGKKPTEVPWTTFNVSVKGKKII